MTEGDYTISVSVCGSTYIPEERSITVASGSPVVETFALFQNLQTHIESC